MKNKNLIFYFIIAFIAFYTEGSLVAQTYGMTIASGAKMTIQSGTILTVANNLGTKVDGTNSRLISNGGTVNTQGSLLNQNNGSVQGGTFRIGGSLNNTGTFTNVDVQMYSGSTTISSTASLGSLTLQTPNPSSPINLGSNITILGTLNFTTSSGFLQLNNFNLSCANVYGFSSNNFVITNGTGGFETHFTDAPGFQTVFPVGISSTSYSPISVATFTTLPLMPNLRVHVKDTVLKDPNLPYSPSNTLASGIVNRVWSITETTTPFPKSLIITPQWNGTDELSGFDPTKCGVSKWNSTTGAWDLAWSNVGARNGTGPYTLMRNGFTEFGLFAVGSKPVATYVQLSAKIFLQGAYASGGLMNEGLRTINVIPMAENTTAVSGQSPRPNAYTHIAWGGSEAVTPTAFNAQPNPNDNIVDWVFVELRDPSVSSTVLHTRAALLQKDGDVVNEDGSSPLKSMAFPMVIIIFLSSIATILLCGLQLPKVFHVRRQRSWILPPFYLMP
jgi:hypothetical protein